MLLVGLAACGRLGFEARTADGGRERDAATDAHADAGPIATAISTGAAFTAETPTFTNGSELIEDVIELRTQ